MILEAKAAEKWYFRKKGGSNRFFAVQKTDLVLEPKKVTVLTGRSGSGKTTLMNMMGGLLTPDGGHILCDGQDLYALTDDALSRLRNCSFGMIPQAAGVLSTITVMENILLARGIYKDRPGQEKNVTALQGSCRDYAHLLLERMGIADLENSYPDELSGGELKRMSVARALAGRPDVIFADEPTSDLDDANMEVVLQLLREAADAGAAVFIVTHDQEALSYADLSLHMSDGNITSM